MNNDTVKELYALTEQFIANIRTIALKSEHEEQRQLLTFVKKCKSYMKKNPIGH